MIVSAYVFSDGVELAQFGAERREYVPLSKTPKLMQDALLAVLLFIRSMNRSLVRSHLNGNAVPSRRIYAAAGTKAAAQPSMSTSG